MKITKSQLREWIKEALNELEDEESSEEEPSQVDALGLEDNPFEKEDVTEGIVKETSKRVYVKEIKQWMKTLEENRYKKVPQADARRVAWFVNNNLSEDYDSMPDSMRKKWAKAAYGRERYLAREFIKHKKNEQKLRESIRRIINTKIGGGHLLNENTISDINKYWSKGVKLGSPEGKAMKKENAKLIKLLNMEMKKLGIDANFSMEVRFTGAYSSDTNPDMNKSSVLVRFTGPLGSKIQAHVGEARKFIEKPLKPNTSIKDIAKQIKKLIK